MQWIVAAMDGVKFSSFANHGECEAVCPKQISTRLIGRLNREYLRSTFAAGSDRSFAGRPGSSAEFRAVSHAPQESERGK